MNVICFGDSNTYGYDPRSYLGGRYDTDSRWVDILAGQSATWERTAGRFLRLRLLSLPTQIY